MSNGVPRNFFEVRHPRCVE